MTTENLYYKMNLYSFLSITVIVVVVVTIVIGVVYKAKQLMEYLKSICGKNVLTGQYLNEYDDFNLPQ